MAGGQDARLKVRILEDEFISMKDGVELAAKIWLPANADKDNPVPGVFEFLPYRKRDNTLYRDTITYQHFAEHGYAGVRVDQRGFGNSTGYVQDEYVQQEHDDAVECIEWISRQAWCTGHVGMMGISWGGFNALQLAARQPEALKAFISISFTDDRFADDIHFKGDAMLMDNVRWAATMEGYAGLPPDPLIRKDWKELWLDRLDQLEPIAANWLQQQVRNSYYKQGSVCEDYSAVKIPALLIGGYADGYTNTVGRTYQNIQCPKRAIVGPWVHLYPHISEPGPLWGFCSEAVSWWDQWLKDSPSPAPPKFIVYVQKDVPVPCKGEVDGRWIEDPVSDVETLYLSEEGLGKVSGSSTMDICSSEYCGRQIATYFPMSIDTMPDEQSPDDKLSQVFDTPAFEGVKEYVGRPKVTLSVASDKPVANLFVRLCVVDEGRSRLLAYTGINLNLTPCREQGTALEPGIFQEVSAELDFIGETIQPGQKLRLALSTTCFPMFVPNPEKCTLSVDLSKCKLELPLLVSFNSLAEPVPPISEYPTSPITLRKPACYERTSHINELMVVRKTSSTGEKVIAPHGLVTQATVEETESISEGDPNSATQRVVNHSRWSRGDNWEVEVTYTIDFTMTKDEFITDAKREAKHNGEVVFSREYSNRVQRQFH